MYSIVRLDAVNSVYSTVRWCTMYCIVQLDGVESIVLSDIPCTVRLDGLQRIV